MFRKFLSNLGRFSGFLIPFIVGIVLVHFVFKSLILAPADPAVVDTRLFEVPKGASLKSVAESLEQQGLLKNWYSIYFINKLKANGEEVKILAGEYELSPSFTPARILDIITGGKIVQHPLTITPGSNIQEVIQAIAKSGIVKLEEIQKAMNDRNLMVQLEIPALIPEGFLYPETYNFSKPTTAEQVLSRIVQDGKKHIEEGIPNWQTRAKEIGLNAYQILTLASIVEKETGKAEERARIASVFHNRIRIGMPLQSDPTVIYGIPNFNGNLTKEDLKTPGPYNTYLNTGLPPTPICNPGLEAIKAVLYPEDTDYLYFVATGDGGHQFSATYKEHVQAVNKYQKGG